MSWGDIFFGFRGRIDRKTWWSGFLLVKIAGLLFAGLLAYLATGAPLASEVWERPDDKASVWGPVWAAYFGFLVWPLTALAVKRLHDRSQPVWVWYVYYSLSLAISLLPLKSASGEVNALPGLLGIPLAFFAGYLFFELGVLRGTLGPNSHGADTLPPDYYGGDYNVWSWLFAVEGRISRWKWWLGVLILLSVIMALSSAIGYFVMGSHPEIEQHLSDPEWFNSPEAAPVREALRPWDNIAGAIFGLVLWSSLALGVKRLQDRGLSSWLILVVVLPVMGGALAPTLKEAFGLSDATVTLALLLMFASAIWSVLQFGILKGETGPNKHGPDPLAG